MGNEIVTLDLPRNLSLSPVEEQIVRDFVAGTPAKLISSKLGIPNSAVLNLLRKDEIKIFIQEMIDARNSALKMELPNLLMDIIADKVLQIEEDKGRMADATKRDLVDVVRTLNDLIKTSDSSKESEDGDGFSKLYQQINVIQQKD